MTDKPYEYRETMDVEIVGGSLDGMVYKIPVKSVEWTIIGVGLNEVTEKYRIERRGDKVVAIMRKAGG